MVDVVVWWRAAAAVLALVLALAPAVQAQPPGVTDAYTIFALERVQLAGRTEVTGDVGVNDGEAILGRRASVSESVAAETVRLSRGSRVGGLYCVLVVGGAESCEALPVPIVSTSELPLVQASPGTEDVRVPRRARRRPLDPGSYRDVVVGPRAELRLLAGTFVLRELRLGSRATLRCEGPCEIRVRDRVVVGPAVQVGLASGDGLVDLVIEGRQRDVALRIGRRATVEASVYAPGGAIRLGRASRIVGGLVGRTIRVGPRTKVAPSAIQ